MSNYYKIHLYDVANGPGLRTAIFFSGCEHACKGCFNEVIWSFDKGKEYSHETYEIIKNNTDERISGLSILGGEPMNPKNIRAVYELIKNFKKDFPNKTIWLWSGYTFEELLSEEYEKSLNKQDTLDNIHQEVIKNIDVLVDGRFISDLKDLRLKWKGSSNQRVIDTKKTLATHKLVLYCD